MVSKQIKVEAIQIAETQYGTKVKVTSTEGAVFYIRPHNALNFLMGKLILMELRKPTKPEQKDYYVISGVLSVDWF